MKRDELDGFNIIVMTEASALCAAAKDKHEANPLMAKAMFDQDAAAPINWFASLEYAS